MGVMPGDAAGRGAWLRHQRAAQRARLAMYVITPALGAALKLAGVLVISWAGVLGCGAAALASVGLCFSALRALERTPPRATWVAPLLFHPRLPGWSFFDVGLTTAVLALSGGIASEWWIFYAGALIGAGFNASLGAALIAAGASIAAYLITLAALGQLDGHGVAVALSRMASLTLVNLLVLRGALELGRKRALVGKLRDAETRKVEELTRLATALDQRTRELADANLRILEADRHKSQFLASMSHELRTPLNSIIGFSEILIGKAGAAGGAPGIDAKQLRFLQNIHGSGTHLLGLINDILDLTKIEAGRMEVHPETLQVAPLVESVLGVMRGTANRREIQLVAELPEDLPPLEADEARLKQILFNLLSNGVKFSPDRATVTLRARVLAPEASPLRRPSLELTVEDRGIGIDPADQHKLFQEFRQLDTGSARKHEGTGLGLALVKKFVDLHAGRIAVDSRIGEGARFTVILPLEFMGERSAPSSLSSLPALIAEPEDGRARVLVVEDDDAAWERIAGSLDAYRTARARTGEEALVMARELRPAAITLDLILPGMDGWEVLRKLKADPLTRGVPVIIVSLLEGRELGVAMGADGYFVKPPDGKGLAGLLAQILGEGAGASGAGGAGGAGAETRRGA